MVLFDCSATVIRNKDWPQAGGSANPGTGDGLLLFMSSYDDVTLAWMPLTPKGPPSPVDSQLEYDKSDWRYWKGPAPSDWSQRRSDAKGIWASSGRTPPGVSKFSANWIPSLRRWLLLWGAPAWEDPDNSSPNGATSAIVAPAPWGPWESVDATGSSPPGTSDGFSGNPPNLIDGRQAFPWAQSAGYSPNLIPRFTRYDPSTGQTTLYYTMSFNLDITKPDPKDIPQNHKRDEGKSSTSTPNGYSYGAHLMKAVLSCSK